MILGFAWAQRFVFTQPWRTRRVRELREKATLIQEYKEDVERCFFTLRRRLMSEPGTGQKVEREIGEKVDGLLKGTDTGLKLATVLDSTEAYLNAGRLYLIEPDTRFRNRVINRFGGDVEHELTILDFLVLFEEAFAHVVEIQSWDIWSMQETPELPGNLASSGYSHFVYRFFNALAVVVGELYGKRGARQHTEILFALWGMDVNADTARRARYR